MSISLENQSIVDLCTLCQVLSVGGYLHLSNRLCGISFDMYETDVNLSGTVLVLLTEEARKKEVFFGASAELLQFKMLSSNVIKKLKPSRSSLESLSYQFIQRCSVSGTAKGKAKLKSGQPLKKSKVSTKKGKPASAKDGGKKGGSSETIEQRLAATAPMRFMKPKEREREAEREKMGLVSKATEQAREKLKKQKDEFSSPWVIGTPGLDFISLGLVDADKIPKYDLTVEDGRMLAKEYSRVLMRGHRARQAAISALLKCKKEAIEALPENLKEAALVPDLTPFPANRIMPALTPPIEGYIEKINEAARRSLEGKKRR